MPDWMSYAYCERCDRPLRENKFRRTITGGGESQQIRYDCAYCCTLGRKPVSMLGFPMGYIVGWFLVFLGFCIAAWNYFVRAWDHIVTVSMLGTMTLLCLMGFARTWREQSKCKPIYDRWVIQHGTDPDKWPGASKPE